MTKEEFIQSIALDGEEWRDVVGYEGYYIVSNCGRIASVRESCEYVYKGEKRARYMPQHLCSTSIAPSTRYRRMTLIRNVEKHTQLVHRIVATAFVPNPQGFPIIDHIDDNPENNNAHNLRWCTQKENMNKDHRRREYKESRSGTPAPNRIPVVRIGSDGVTKQYPSAHHVVEDGFHQSAVTRVCRGQQPSHKGYKWMYLSDYNKK